jgi:hypothetical protein
MGTRPRHPKQPAKTILGIVAGLAEDLVAVLDVITRSRYPTYVGSPGNQHKPRNQQKLNIWQSELSPV